MVDIYGYLKVILPDDTYLKDIYRCTGLASMEGLVENVRTTRFPCLVVEIGNEGWIDILSSNNYESSLVFYVLEKKDNASIDEIQAVLARTRAKGMEIIRRMRADGSEYGDPCFGVDFERIHYMRVGPIAMSSYGHCFSLTVNEQ